MGEENKKNEQSTEELREHLSDGGFGSDAADESDTVVDQTPDDSVVEGFLSQFGVQGETPLKAHDWKVYLPSHMCNSTFWGPLFGIIREESESIYVFDSKRFESDQYLIGYIDNGTYASSKCYSSFSFKNKHVIGLNTDQGIVYKLTNDPVSSAIAALRIREDGGEFEFGPDGRVICPADPSSWIPPTNFSTVQNANQMNHLLGTEVYDVRVKEYDTVTNLFSRNTGLLESSIMLDKRAVLVGCGSVGSFVAMQLARSGVGKFVLCDTDTLEIHNICRHQCGYDDLGRYKVDAVKDKILNINPNAEVITYRSTIQRVPEDELLPLLGRDTIIIGGGDNRASADWACKLAIRTDSTFVATCCWTRAFAGEIFYWASGRNLSCYSCALGGLIDEERPESHATYFGSDEEKGKLSFEPGIAIDIDFVTIIAVKLALDLLNRDNPDYTPRVIDNLRQYTWVCNTNSTRIGGERASIFSYPLQITRNLTVHKDENCPFCGGK